VTTKKPKPVEPKPDAAAHVVRLVGAVGLCAACGNAKPGDKCAACGN